MRRDIVCAGGCGNGSRVGTDSTRAWASRFKAYADVPESVILRIRSAALSAAQTAPASPYGFGSSLGVLTAVVEGASRAWMSIGGSMSLGIIGGCGTKTETDGSVLRCSFSRH